MTVIETSESNQIHAAIDEALNLYLSLAQSLSPDSCRVKELDQFAIRVFFLILGYCPVLSSPAGQRLLQVKRHLDNRIRAQSRPQALS